MNKASYDMLAQIATPAGSPPAGFQFLYVKSDGALYTKNSAGAETKLGPPGSGTFGLTQCEQDLGGPVTSGQFDIAGLSGLTVGRPVYVQQAIGPYTGKGTLDDDIEMDIIIAAGLVISSTTIRVHWQSMCGPVLGNFKFNYVIG